MGAPGSRVACGAPQGLRTRAPDLGGPGRPPLELSAVALALPGRPEAPQLRPLSAAGGEANNVEN